MSIMKNSNAESATAEKPKRGFVKYIIGAVIVVLLGVVMLNGKVEEEPGYKGTINVILNRMKDNEDDLNASYELVYGVWHNSIHGVMDEATDPYAYPDGFREKDFRVAVHNLYVDEDFVEQLEYYKELQEELQTLKTKLVDVPEELQDMNTTLEQLIDVYTDYCELVIKPVGSLTDIEEQHEIIVNAYNDLLAEVDDYMKQYNE